MGSPARPSIIAGRAMHAPPPIRSNLEDGFGWLVEVVGCLIWLLTLHVRWIGDGWRRDRAGVGDGVGFLGPFGSCGGALKRAVASLVL
uniref:Uncharacterized protein n=1 Tax=Arundo donax TaxID=35708 RepID=A0A0A9EJ22_ARUDO